MSRLCRLKTNTHGEDGLWAYNEIKRLRKERDALKEALVEIEQITNEWVVESCAHDALKKVTDDSKQSGL